MNIEDLVPVDIKEYLIEASLTLYGETDQSQEVSEWIPENFEAIIEKAKDLQLLTMDKFFSSQKQITQILSNRVWCKLNGTEPINRTDMV